MLDFSEDIYRVKKNRTENMHEIFAVRHFSELKGFF